MFSRHADGIADSDAGASRLGSIRSLNWFDAPAGAAFADAPLAGLTGYTGYFMNVERNLVTLAASCRRLATLIVRCHHECLRNESLAVIATISSLTRLDISETMIDDASALEPLASLTDLSLRRNAYLDAGLEALGRMSALTAIDLERTAVAPTDLRHLRNAARLAYSKYDDRASANFSDMCLPRLASLTLAMVDLYGRSHIPSLTRLMLVACTTARESRESLGRLTSLTSLDIRSSEGFDDEALGLMPLSITELVVPNFQAVGIRRLTNLVSLNLVCSCTLRNRWPLSQIADYMPATLRSLTLTSWSSEHLEEAVESAVTLTTLTSLSIVTYSWLPVVLTGDTLARLAAATHIASISI